MVQTHDDRCLIDGEARRKRLKGRLDSNGLSVAMVDFWQQYLKSLRRHGQGVEIGICPAIDAVDYGVGGDDEVKLYFYLKDGVYRLREGLSKTHTLYIGGDVPSEPPPVPQAPPEWYCESGAFGDALPVSDGRFAEYEAKFAQVCREYLQDRDDSREYGMPNFGDWCKSSFDWGNMEYDTPFVFFVQWARSGDVRWLEEACRGALHHRDVDTCHASADEIDVGGVYRHCTGHTGGYYPVGTPGLSSSAQLTVTHMWAEGFLLHYLLTGDPRSLDTARMAADRWDSHYTRNYDFTNCRVNGWHLIHDMAIYHATRDRFYLNAAHIIFERTLERQDDNGGWSHLQVLAHCECDPPKHMGNAGFQLAILLSGLRHYHQATGDARVADIIVRGAKFLIDELWTGGSDGFRYTSCPNSGVGADDIGQVLAGISYAWRISRKPVFEPVLRSATRQSVEALVPHGRPFSSNLHALPNVLYDAAELLGTLEV